MNPRVLLYTRTLTFRHEGTESVAATLQRAAAADGIEIDWTEDPSALEQLNGYDAVAFCNTSGEVVEADGRASLERFVAAGGGFAGIHGATTACESWDRYGQLLGARFVAHPPGVHEAVIAVDTSHPSTSHLPASWRWADEWYLFDRHPDGFQVLATIDASMNGAQDGRPQPVVWFRDAVWYTALGHDASMYEEELYQRHLIEGIRSVLRRRPL